MTPQETIPSSEVQYAAEDVTWGVDLSAVTSTPINVTVALALDGDNIPLADLPSVSGAAVSQRIRTGVLTPSNTPYTLTVTYTPSGTTNVLVAVLRIVCPQ